MIIGWFSRMMVFQVNFELPNPGSVVLCFMLRKVCYIRERDFKKEIEEFKKRHVSRFSSLGC